MRKFGYALALALVGTCGFAAAQARQNPATLDDLLSEIRGLRADINRSSSASVRTQMVVARMQIQEQRIAGVVRQVAEVQNQLAQARQVAAGLEGPLKQAESQVTRVAADVAVSPEERREVQLHFADIKERLTSQIAEARQRVQELTMRENELISQFSTEQIRWNDFNERLDALERSFVTQ